MSELKQTILAKKAALAEAISDKLAKLSDDCANVWPDADKLDHALEENINRIPNCHLLYAWDVNGIEVSSMVQPDRTDKNWRGKDLSERPYLKNNLPFKGIMLSSLYWSMYTEKQCITALQAINRSENLVGFIAADFAVNDLLKDTKLSAPDMHWQQFRGDPAVRSTVFMQTRSQSLLDEHMDEVLHTFHSLMTEHGVFHSKIHFSSGRCSFWMLDDPYNYRIHGVDEIVNPEICLAYPMHDYPKNAQVTPAELREVFKQFKQLRFADDTIYLRSASVNTMNGMLGLTFSCDGSHYMSVQEFLEKDLAFWVGSLGKTEAINETKKNVTAIA